MVASLLMGAASTALWSFGSEIVAQRLGWQSAGAGLLWVVIGAAGIAGAGAGALVARLGIDWAHRLCLAALAAAIVLVGMGGVPALVLLGGALFGAAYITLSGIYLVWGVAALSERPATGLTIAFLGIAVGQTLGAPVFGALASWLSLTHAVVLFALLALLAGTMRSAVVEAVPAG